MTALIYYIAVVKGPEAWAVRIEKINVAHTRHLIFVHPLDLRFKDPSRAPSHDRQWYICTRASSTGARGQFMQSQPRESIFRLKNGFGPPRCVGAAETGKGGGGASFMPNKKEKEFELKSSKTCCYLGSINTYAFWINTCFCGFNGTPLMAYAFKDYQKAALYLAIGGGGNPGKQQEFDLNEISVFCCLQVLKYSFLCKANETYAKRATYLTRFQQWLKENHQDLTVPSNVIGITKIDPAILREYEKQRENVRDMDTSLLCCNFFTPVSSCAAQAEIVVAISNLEEDVRRLDELQRTLNGDNKNIIESMSPMTIQTMR